jgi:hypothetical protein
LIYKCGGIDKRTIEKFEKVRVLFFFFGIITPGVGQLQKWVLPPYLAQNILGGVLLAGSLFFSCAFASRTSHISNHTNVFGYGGGAEQNSHCCPMHEKSIHICPCA